jgi:hypothetical protein
MAGGKKMSRIVCHKTNDWHTLLCVNNYRGKDYGKPETTIDCERCWLNPKHEGKKQSKRDPDKVVE